MEDTAVVTQKSGVTGMKLKIIALTAMFIDHFAAVLLENYLNWVIPSFYDEESQRVWMQENQYVTYLWVLYYVMRLIGRFGFPLFAFLIVEGFQHTHSVKKYAINLGVFAIISELPFNLGFSGKLLNSSYQNVYFTLFLGLMSLVGIYYFEEIKKNSEKLKPLFYLAALAAGPFIVFVVLRDFEIVRESFPIEGTSFYVVLVAAGAVTFLLFSLLGIKWDMARKNLFTGVILSSAICGFAADFLKTDYGAGGVLTIVILYLLRKKKKLAFSMACVELTLLSVAEFTTFFMLIPIGKYNGKRGMKLNKYVYYAFYPVHLGLLYLVTYLLGYTGFAVK
ncbi:MAG: hypothetical protein IKO41_02620 [Lachnospiraceae bacterium]|nr:hypothetical protein [Lachnospiraceae bacterium]